MSDDRIPMTREGYEKRKADLDRMKNVEMIEVAKRVAAARDLGDLSENAEYHAAKEQQSLNEGRIKELETLLALADIIDISKLSGTTVKFGATVKIVDEDTEEERKYTIVGDAEAEASKGRISISSPIARALIGKSKGDTIEVAAPGGSRSYEIIEVKYL
jgi:transcription elongation factor GreA